MADNNRSVITTVCLIVILSTLTDACFPSKYWISCLFDTCKFGGTCPGDPTAKCRMEKTECNGCKAMWFTPSGEKANCSVPKNLKLCPGGERVVHCKVDSCKWPCDHADFKGATCRQGYCGECAAEYHIKGSWVTCPVTTTDAKGETLPVDTVIGEKCDKKPCSVKECINKRCPAVPRAVCRPDRAGKCGTCKSRWYVDGIPVNCKTGEYISDPKSISPIVSPPVTSPPWQRTCALGEALEHCDMKVCEKKTCRNFPDAECRPDGCGGCKATWYSNNKLVDCFSTECPPKVPIVKCVDDPCKYFGHYCPTAQCRASQCGKCEAKFFADGHEIDCTMPPKECEVGIEPRICPWYTCPADICPSNSRLMCRINPCGNQCEYEFVDIYNGELLPCRVFDGDGTRPKTTHTGAKDVILTDTNQIPMLGNLIPESKPISQSLPRSHAATGGDTGVFDVQDVPVSTDVKSHIPHAPADKVKTPKPTGGNNFNVEPVFIKPGPPIVDADLLYILQSFPHEMTNIPSASIQSALKNKKTGMSTSATSQQNILPPKNPSSFNNAANVIRAGKPKFLNTGSPSITNKQSINIPLPEKKQQLTAETFVPVKPKQPFVETIHPAVPKQNTEPLNQLHSVPKPTVKTIPGKQYTQPIKHKSTSSQTSSESQPPNVGKADSKMFNNVPAKTTHFQQSAVGSEIVPKKPMKPLYPELKQVQTGPIAAGRPKGFKSKVIGQKQNKNKTNKDPSGIPISMQLFTRWASL